MDLVKRIYVPDLINKEFKEPEDKNNNKEEITNNNNEETKKIRTLHRITAHNIEVSMKF